jgi:hypothetical protein
MVRLIPTPGSANPPIRLIPMTKGITATSPTTPEIAVAGSHQDSSLKTPQAAAANLHADRQGSEASVTDPSV